MTFLVKTFPFCITLIKYKPLIDLKARRSKWRCSQLNNDRGKSAFFSFLAPHNYIPPHRGITKGIIRCHLALTVPKQRDQLGLRVGDESRHWEEGRCLVFDDTFEHEVWNRTDEERIVLLIDVERPMKFLGKMVARGLVFGIQRSAYVQEARQNLDNWENYFVQATSKSTPVMNKEA